MCSVFGPLYVWVLYLVRVVWCNSWCPFQFDTPRSRVKITDYFTLNMSVMSCVCVSVVCVFSSLCLGLVCNLDCGIS